jgi:hypothetical protein
VATLNERGNAFVLNQAIVKNWVVVVATLLLVVTTNTKSAKSRIFVFIFPQVYRIVEKEEETVLRLLALYQALSELKSNPKQ